MTINIKAMTGNHVNVMHVCSGLVTEEENDRERTRELLFACKQLYYQAVLG